VSNKNVKSIVESQNLIVNIIIHKEEEEEEEEE